jgi:hypothetical protein
MTTFATAMDLAGKIKQYVQTWHLRMLDQLHRKVPGIAFGPWRNRIALPDGRVGARATLVEPRLEELAAQRAGPIAATTRGFDYRLSPALCLCQRPPSGTLPTRG